MTVFLKKHPYIMSASFLIIIYVAASGLYDFYQNAKTEKELSLMMMELKDQPITLEGFLTNKKSPQNEDNAFFYYQQAADAAANNDSSPDDERITRLIKEGNSRENHYLGDGLERLKFCAAPTRTARNTQIPPPGINDFKIRETVNAYYKDRISRQIDDGIYDQSYEDMIDWTIFMQKSSLNDSIKNNTKTAWEVYVYNQSFYDFKNTLDRLIKKAPSPKYNKRIREEVKKIITLQAEIPAESLNIVLVSSLLIADNILNNKEFNVYCCKKYHINKIKITNIKNFQSLKQQLAENNLEETKMIIYKLYSKNPSYLKLAEYFSAIKTVDVYDSIAHDNRSLRATLSQLEEIKEQYGEEITEKADEEQTNEETSATGNKDENIVAGHYSE